MLRMLGHEESTGRMVSKSDFQSAVTTAIARIATFQLKILQDRERVLLKFDFSSQSVIQNGEEHCQDQIEAHKQCMRDLGFNI